MTDIFEGALVEDAIASLVGDKIQHLDVFGEISLCQADKVGHRRGQKDRLAVVSRRQLLDRPHAGSKIFDRQCVYLVKHDHTVRHVVQFAQFATLVGIDALEKLHIGRDHKRRVPILGALFHDVAYLAIVAVRPQHIPRSEPFGDIFVKIKIRVVFKYRQIAQYLAELVRGLLYYGGIGNDVNDSLFALLGSPLDCEVERTKRLAAAGRHIQKIDAAIFADVAHRLLLQHRSFLLQFGHCIERSKDLVQARFVFAPIDITSDALFAGAEVLRVERVRIGQTAKQIANHKLVFIRTECLSRKPYIFFARTTIVDLYLFFPRTRVGALCFQSFSQCASILIFPNITKIG